MKENKASYRQIMKATSLFGGVQVFNILISIVRSKIIALLLGPAGMGIAGLLNSTTGLVGALTNFGLGISAVRNVAEAHESGNDKRIAKVVIVFRRLVWFTGLLGALVTLFLSSWLSQITFGNKEYTIAFIWLSCTLLLSQLTRGQNVLLQGTRKLQYLAKANLLGSFLGLLISVPIYYFYGIDGIVPAIIISSILSFFIANFFANKVKFEKIKVTLEETRLESRSMLQLGIMLSLSGLMSTGAAFILRIFISNTGGVEDVGLYAAGFSIINTYVGLVFTAMGTDYFPRLSGIAHDFIKSNLLINQQAEIGVLILAPILAIFLIFIDWIVVLLYSSKFIPINEMLHWAALGMYFKVVGWCMGYLLIAKGATKVFFSTQVVSTIYSLLLNIIGYKFYGLGGLGISYLLGYIIYFFQIYFVLNKRYKFSFNKNFLKIFGLQLSIGLLCFMMIKFVPNPWAYLFGLPFIGLSAYYSFIELDKRIDLVNQIKSYIENKK